MERAKELRIGGDSGLSFFKEKGEGRKQGGEKSENEPGNADKLLEAPHPAPTQAHN